MAVKTFKQLLGEQLTQCRKAAKMSVLDLERKSGISRRSIYDIEAGLQNVRADQYETLIRSCSVSPEQWMRGIEQKLKSKMTHDEQNLHHMLTLILETEDPELLVGIKVSLDAISDKALRLKKRPREPSGPQLGEAGHNRKTNTRAS